METGTGMEQMVQIVVQRWNPRTNMNTQTTTSQTAKQKMQTCTTQAPVMATVAVPPEAVTHTTLLRDHVSATKHRHRPTTPTGTASKHPRLPLPTIQAAAATEHPRPPLTAAVQTLSGSARAACATFDLGHAPYVFNGLPLSLAAAWRQLPCQPPLDAGFFIVVYQTL